MNAFTYWLRRMLKLPITWHCTRVDPCRHPEVPDPTRDGGAFVIEHSGIHAACTHCTNPHVHCRRCGAFYLDRVEPNPARWKYQGLLRGWVHVGRCLTRRS